MVELDLACLMVGAKMGSILFEAVWNVGSNEIRKMFNESLWRVEEFSIQILKNAL